MNRDCILEAHWEIEDPKATIADLKAEALDDLAEQAREDEWSLLGPPMVRVLHGIPARIHLSVPVRVPA